VILTPPLPPSTMLLFGQELTLDNVRNLRAKYEKD
jgi:hypothetical protein